MGIQIRIFSRSMVLVRQRASYSEAIVLLRALLVKLGVVRWVKGCSPYEEGVMWDIAPQ